MYVKKCDRGAYYYLDVYFCIFSKVIPMKVLEVIIFHILGNKGSKYPFSIIFEIFGFFKDVNDLGFIDMYLENFKVFAYCPFKFRSKFLSL